MEGNFGGRKIWQIHRKTHLVKENLAILLPLDKNTLSCYVSKPYSVSYCVRGASCTWPDRFLAQSAITCSISAQ